MKKQTAEVYVELEVELRGKIISAVPMTRDYPGDPEEVEDFEVGITIKDKWLDLSPFLTARQIDELRDKLVEEYRDYSDYEEGDDR